MDIICHSNCSGTIPPPLYFTFLGLPGPCDITLNFLSWLHPWDITNILDFIFVKFYLEFFYLAGFEPFYCILCLFITFFDYIYEKSNFPLQKCWHTIFSLPLDTRASPAIKVSLFRTDPAPGHQNKLYVKTWIIYQVIYTLKSGSSKGECHSPERLSWSYTEPIS